MSLDKIQSKRALGIFDKNSKAELSNEKIVWVAANYWTKAMQNYERQINYLMGNGVILLSERDLARFKRNFVHYILKMFPEKGSIMLWTSDEKNFLTVGTDAYLPIILKHCNLKLTCLPSDLCMWISSEQIVVEQNFQQEIIYKSKVKKMDVR